jgi:hypothetical protein
VKCGLFVHGAPKMHNVPSLSRVGHLHIGRLHVHGSSYEGMVLSSLQSLLILMLIRVKQGIVEWASSVFTNACICFIVSVCP